MPQNAHNPKDYVWIDVWGRMLGSFEYYRIGQQELAARENAPLTAIYQNARGKWVTAEEISSPSARERLERHAAARDLVVPAKVKLAWSMMDDDYE